MKLLNAIAAAALFVVACAPQTAAPSPASTFTTGGTPAQTVAAATTSTAATTPATTSVPLTPQPATTGTITGLTGYPAEGHPALTVYAISTSDNRVWFSVEIPRATDPAKPPYTISGVRPGTYNLFAAAEGSDRTGGAYTEYVKCGMNASCSDHTPIAVTVRAGETVRDIEVSDWYAPASTYPARPR